MAEEKMPFNVVGEDIEKKAADEAALEEEWRAKNLPAEKLVFHWRYASRKIQLYERRLRSLAQFNVGPAVQAWVRSRLEWMRDNRLYEQPDGVLELTIDPKGDVAMEMLPLQDAPSLSADQLVWKDGALAGCELPGTLWAVAQDGARAFPSHIRHAADTFTRDLVTTLGGRMSEEPLPRAALDATEIFLIDDGHGITPCAGRGGPLTDKLVACFDKLWSGK